MINNVNKTLFLMIFWVIAACGGEEGQYVQNFEYDVGDNQLGLGVEFNNDLTLNTDLSVPILDYGYVYLIANDDQFGFRIKTDLNLEALVDPQILNLSKTRLLPNEELMSPYVATDVARLWIKASDDISVNVYFGLEPNQFYFGVALELGFVDEDFPAGLVITQRIRDAKQRMLGVVTLYGPEVQDGKIIKPGGMFFISNVTDLKSHYKPSTSNLGVTSLSYHKGQIIPDESPFINQDKYKIFKNQRKLLKLYRKKAKKAGFID